MGTDNLRPPPIRFRKAKHRKRNRDETARGDVVMQRRTVVFEKAWKAFRPPVLPPHPKAHDAVDHKFSRSRKTSDASGVRERRSQPAVAFFSRRDEPKQKNYETRKLRFKRVRYFLIDFFRFGVLSLKYLGPGARQVRSCERSRRCTS